MPKRRNTEQEKEWTIYLLRSPKDKKILVGYCLRESLRETYRHNLKGRRDASKDFIQAIYPDRPCLFVLENFVGTARDATNYLLVWLKIFLENGYVSYNRECLKEMSEHLYIDNAVRYRERNGLLLNEITSCRSCQMPVYKKEKCDYYPDEKGFGGEN